MIDERELREMLGRRAGTISATPTDAPKALRRARRRLARNVAVGTLVGLAMLAGAFAGVRTIQAAPTPPHRPASTHTPGDSRSTSPLAYVVDGDIYVANWDGSNPVRIADGRPPSDCRGLGEYWGEGPLWSPDGRYLAYRHNDCEGGDGGDVVISDPEGNVVATFPGGSAGWQVAWSPDSTRVAVWVRFEKTIGVYGLDGVRQRLLTVPPGWKPPGDVDPVWLPDGESLLVPSAVEIPLDGTTPRKLPLANRSGGRVTYSPDGSRVAYSTNRSLVVAGADGSPLQEVLGAGSWNVVWSPTGNRIAFTSGRRSNGTLRVLDVATGKVTLLADMDGSNTLWALDFSPESDRVLFARAEDKGRGVTSLWSINADGSDPRRLVAGTGRGDWRPLSQSR